MLVCSEDQINTVCASHTMHSQILEQTPELVGEAPQNLNF